MPDWTLFEQRHYDALCGSSLADSRPSLLMNNNAGNWVEVTAAASRDYQGIWIQNPAGRDAGGGAFWQGNFFLYLAVGAAGSEQIIMDGIPFHATDNRHGDGGLHWPCYIPKGSRIAVSWMSASGNPPGDTYMQIYGYYGGWHADKPWTRHLRLGTDWNDDHFGNGDPTSYDHQLGSLIELPAGGSTDIVTAEWQELNIYAPFDIKHIIPVGMPSRSTVNEIGDGLGAANSANFYYFEIGHGAVGSEVGVTSQLHKTVHIASSWNTEAPFVHPGMPCYIPRGSRIVARGVTNNSDGSDNGMSVFMYAFG